jgi:hypothetical protein
MERSRRVFAHPNVKPARLQHPGLCLRAPKLELVPAQLKVNGSDFTWSEGHSLKALQLPHRPGRATCLLMNVKLCDGVSSHFACVCHRDGHVDSFTFVEVRMTQV